MTEDKFKELVNLYIDNEISPAELDLLRKEITSDAARRAEFESLSRFHQAMSVALKSGVAAQETNKFQATESAVADRSIQPVVYVAGLAACAAFAFIMVGLNIAVKPMMTQADRDPSGVHLPELTDDQIGRAEYARFLARQRELERRQATLAAQLRLLGMNPRIRVESHEMETVDLEAVKRRRVIAPNHSERIQQLAELTPLPETQIIQFEYEEPQSSGYSAWPSGFKSSLASFK